MEEAGKLANTPEYASHSQPPHAITALLRENIQGIEKEIVGLRILGRKLLELQTRAANNQEQARLGTAYTRLAIRLADMVKAEQELSKKAKPSDWAEAVLEAMDRHEVEEGRQPVSQAVRAQALGAEEELGANSRRLVEEVAAVRHVLRSTFKAAMDAEGAQDTLKLAESYANICARLLKLLRTEEMDAGKLERFLRQIIDEALEESARILGLE